MPQECAADAVALLGWSDVRMTDQVDVVHRLDAHHADEFAVRLVAPELDAGGDLALELTPVHVRLVPAVRGDHAAIRLRGGVDDLERFGALVVAAAADD